MKSIRITTAEFSDDLEHYLSLASNQVIIISRERLDNLVLLSANEYRRLFRNTDPVAMQVEALSQAELQELEQSRIPEKTQELDRLLPKDW